MVQSCFINKDSLILKDQHTIVIHFRARFEAFGDFIIIQIGLRQRLRAMRFRIIENCAVIFFFSLLKMGQKQRITGIGNGFLEKRGRLSVILRRGLCSSKRYISSVVQLHSNLLALLTACSCVAKPVQRPPFVAPEHPLTPVVNEVYHRLQMPISRRLWTTRDVKRQPCSITGQYQRAQTQI